MELPLIYLVIWILQGALCAYFAQKRGRNAVAWFLIGLLFGLFGILALFLFPSLEEEEEQVTKAAEDRSLSPEEGREWFYLDSEHHQHGPFPFETIRSHYEEGKLSQDSYVWNESLDDWKKIHELGLFS